MIHLTGLGPRLISRKSLILSAIALLLLVGGVAVFSSMSATASDGHEFRDVLLFATKSIQLKSGSEVVASGTGSRIVGDVVVNNALPRKKDELSVGVGATTAAQSHLVAETIKVENSANVLGLLHCADVHGAGAGGLSCAAAPTLPIFVESPDLTLDQGEFPLFVTGVPGVDDITVGPNGTHTLPPGDYGDVVVKDNSTLTLSYGIYNVQSVKLTGADAKLLFSGSNDTEVRVFEKLTTSDSSEIGPTIGAPIDASNIVFFVANNGNGSRAVAIGENNVISATLYADTGSDSKLTIGDNTTATGGFLASVIVVGENATVIFDSFFGDAPPVAVDDTATGIENGPAITIDVLLNDTDVDGGPISINSITQTANGTVVITNDGADLTYQPDADYCNDGTPTDDFTYTLAPGGSTATVKVTVDCFNAVLELSDIVSDDDPRGFAIFGGSANPFQTYSGDWAGYSVDIVGDLNGDGFAEVLVGAPEADPDGDTQKGIAYIVWGKPDGMAVELDDVIFGIAGFAMFGETGDYDPITELCNGFLIPCGEATSVGERQAWIKGPHGDALGFDVAAAGDVDGDGSSDIIVSAPYAKADRIYQGKSYVVFGDAYNTSFNVQDIDGYTVIGEEGSDHSRSGSVAEKENGDLAGWSVDAARDINGDGLADLIVTAHNALHQDRGRVYVVYGKEDIDTVRLHEVASEDDDSGFAIIGTLKNGFFPGYGEWMTSAGDFNRDGFGDVLVHPEAFGTPDSFLVFGSEDYQNVTLQNFGEENLARIHHPNFGVVCNPPPVGCQIVGDTISGFAVGGGGDINGDGYSDVVISGFGKDHDLIIYVVLGTDASTDIDAEDIGSGVGGFQIYSDIATMVTWKDEISLVGDVNGDGFDDIVIGTSTTQVDGVNNVGRTYVVFGKPDLTDVSLEDVANGIGGFVINGEAAGDRSGFAVNNSGDVNGDGLADIVIGAYNRDAAGNTNSGQAYIVFGSNYSGAISHFGGEGDNTLTGSLADDAMVAGRGNDLLIGNGGADVYYAGAGDDIVRIAGASFRRIHGGVGYDVLQLQGDGMVLNLASSRGFIDGFEGIDLGLPGIQSLVVTKLDLLNLSDNSNELVVFGPTIASDDTVSVPDGGWTNQGGLIIDGRSFTEFNNGRAALFIETTVDTLFAPTIIAETFNVDENSPKGTVVGTITAFDPDGVITGLSLVSQSGPGTFQVDDPTGVITVTDASQLNFESGITQFTLLVETTDDHGFTSSANMTIDVNDVNEHPTITGFDGLALILEHSPISTVVATAIATDPDAGDLLTFAIISGDDGGLFTIDGSSGLITVANGAGLDYESSPTFTLLIQVTDLGNLTDEQSKVVNILDVTDVETDVVLTFSTMNRDIFSDDGAFDFDPPESRSLFQILPGDPTVLEDFSLDFAGDFTLIQDIDVNTGAFNADIPVDISLSYPDEITPGTPFTLTSDFAMLPSANISGHTPGYSLALSLLVENLTAVGEFAEFELFNQGPYSMDEPYFVTLDKPETNFTGDVIAEDKLGVTGVHIELLDEFIEWDNYLLEALTSFGLPSNEGEFSCGCFPSDDLIEYIVYSYGLMGELSLTHDFTLALNDINATMTLEDGSQLMFNMATTNDITVPAVADVNDDGQVEYTITFDVDTLFTNDTRTKIALGENHTAGFFSLTLTNPITDEPTTTSFGPLIDITNLIMDEVNNSFIFTMGGFNTPTITGTFDMAD